MAHFEKLTKANLEDALNIDLKQSDKDELYASQGHTDWRTILQASIDSSEEVYLIVNDEGVAIAVFGLAEDVNYECRAYPWLLAADDLKKYAKPFLRQSKEMVEGWSLRYDILCNLVSSKNHISMRWLEWLGFTIDRDIKVFLEDKKTVFYQFSMVAFDV